MVEWFDAFVQMHGTWFVAVVIFFESMGLPLPGESLLIGLSVYAATKGGINIQWALAWAVVGAVMGDNVGYLIGRHVGRRALARWGGKIGLTEKRIVLGEYLFDRHGGVVVFVGRFIAFMRTFAALLAGAVHMPWPKFLLWNGLGGLCWVVGYGGAAYLVGDHIKAFIGPIGITLGVVAVAGDHLVRDLGEPARGRDGRDRRGGDGRAALGFASSFCVSLGEQKCPIV